MRSYYTFYSNRLAAAPATYSASTMAYKQRVEADGGTVHDLAYVNSCYQFLAAQGIENSAHGCWINAHFGNKITGSGEVVKAYCLFGNDLVPVAENASRVLLSTAISNRRSYSYNRGALQVENPAYSVNSGKITVGMVSYVTELNTIIFAEYSRNFNGNSGWGFFMEDGLGKLTAGIKPLPDGYNISQITEINTPSVLTKRIATFDLSRASNESVQLANGYTSTVFGNYNIDNPNTYVLGPQPLFFGARGGTNFLTDKAHANGLSVLPIVLPAAAQQTYLSLLAHPYETPASYSQTAQDYIARVEADGGTVAEPALVEECLAFATAHNLDVKHWINPRFGLKTEGSGVRKLYCLKGNDVVVTAGALPELLRVNGKNVLRTNGTSCMDAVTNSAFDLGIHSLETFAVIKPADVTNGTIYSKSVADGQPWRWGLLYDSGNLYSLYSANSPSPSVAMTTNQPSGVWHVLGQEINTLEQQHRVRINATVVATGGDVVNMNHTSFYRYVLFGYMNYNNTAYYPGLNFNGDFMELLMLRTIPTAETRSVLQQRLAALYAGA